MIDVSTQTLTEHTSGISTELASKRRKFDICDTVIGADISLLYYTIPAEFVEKARRVSALMESEFASADPTRRALQLQTAVGICLGLSSALVRWNLCDSDTSPKTALSESDVVYWSDEFLQLLDELCDKDEASERKMLERYKTQLAAGYTAEGLSDTESNVAANEAVAGGLVSLVRNTLRLVRESNIRSFVAGSHTEFGNDYAACLDYPLLLGASLATTNPPLILNALKKNVIPRAELVDKCGSRPAWLSPAAVAARLAVLQNAVSLRPIFLLTGGRKGYVCLQVDPRYSSGDEIVREAAYQHEQLGRELGGVPNVVYKLPATAAGLEACSSLTQMGIGCTATVCFGVFQAMEFARVMNQGRALASYVVVMNGRLAGPVAEQLDEEHKAAAQLAGVAVAKKLHRRFYGSDGDGFDAGKVRILIASLRNYDGHIPDIEDVLGVSSISVFPDIRRAFDETPRQPNNSSITEDIDGDVLASLSKSEIFRQAFYLPGDSDSIRPNRLITLGDDELVQTWEPVRRTLDAFKDAYEETEKMICSLEAGECDG